MTRSRSLVRLVAFAGAVALACTVPAMPAQAAPTADTPVGTVTLKSAREADLTYRWAGASGFQYTAWSADPVWVDYKGVVPPAHAGPDDLPSGTDVVSTVSGSTVTQKHRSTGVTATVTLPAGQAYKAASGWSVLTEDAAGTPHVLRATADGTTDLTVKGLPAGARPVKYVNGGSVRRIGLVYLLDDKRSVGLVDLADGAFRTYVSGTDEFAAVTFNDRWLVADWKSVRVDAPPGTEPTALAVPAFPWKHYAVVGDQLLIGYPVNYGVTGPALTARSLVTGATSTALAQSYMSFAPTADGGALATAGPSGLDWHVYRITPTAAGTTAAEEVTQLPTIVSYVPALALAGGELFLYGDSPSASVFSSFALDATGRPVGPQTLRSPEMNAYDCIAGDVTCPQIEALGDGRTTSNWSVWPDMDNAGPQNVRVTGLDTKTQVNAATGSRLGRITSGSGRYVLYNGGTTNVQKVIDFPNGATAGTVVLTRTRTPASVWGQVLWSTGSTKGSVVGLNLKTKKTVATIATGAPCKPTDVQAVNTWLYWSCGAAGPAGVYDRAAKRSIPVPSGAAPARLADGYLVREDRATHELRLTDFHTGRATTRTVAVLPEQDVTRGGSNGRWAVDRFGGHIAYQKGSRGEVAIVRSGVPASSLAQTEAQTAPRAGGPTAAKPWEPVWQLNKPAAWTLTLTNAAGTRVRALTGDTLGAAVRASWDGLRSDGQRIKGTYTWRLSATPRDHQGPTLTLTGTTVVN
ncbi:hypothetical protein ACW4TU_12035 [Streptomyces sp. QTS52]